MHTNLCNKLDNLDKNIQRHVSGHDATTPFREQGGGNGRQTTGRGKEKYTSEAVVKLYWILTERFFPVFLFGENCYAICEMILNVCYLCVPVLLSHLIRIM